MSFHILNCGSEAVSYWLLWLSGIKKKNGSRLGFRFSISVRARFRVKYTSWDRGEMGNGL